MACGTPVIASKTSSIPEIGGNAARYFDPTDVEAMIEILRNVLYDTSLHQEMRERGQTQAVRFSWMRAACETAEVYRQVKSSSALA
jgi:glycosyltransferase involved in cell wall biosynthesis